MDYPSCGLPEVIEGRLRKLLDILGDMRSLLVACSGGLDSTFLLKAASLSGARVLAVTGTSETTPPWDVEDARRMALEFGVEHRMIETSEMQSADFTQNSPERCFHCKDILFGALKDVALSEGFEHVVDGSTMDDGADYRPGRKAALTHGIRSPLVEAGFHKADIREAARGLGIAIWDKPASPCLSSRFAYGTAITGEALLRTKRAEEYLRSLGFKQLRVRNHGGLARIEVPRAEIPGVIEHSEEVSKRLRALGYSFVCLDLEGHVSGGLNRDIK